jgi:hypothetical protein
MLIVTYAECHLKAPTLSAIMLNVVMLSVVAPQKTGVLDTGKNFILSKEPIL